MQEHSTAELGLLRGELNKQVTKISVWSCLLYTSSVGFQGDQVWLFNPKRRRGRSHKLQTNWEGPYTVKERINDVVYRIQQEGQRKLKVVHLDRLAKYYFRVGLPVRDEQA